MLRALLIGLTLLHLGPGLAFALLAFGCGDGALRLAPLCDGGLGAFIRLTLALWVALTLAALSWALIRGECVHDRPRPRQRAVTLLALVGCGSAWAAIGQWLTNQPAAWLVLPATVAAGWLALANPLACTASCPAPDDCPRT